jgi:small subunit ribosomal protein S18
MAKQKRQSRPAKQETKKEVDRSILLRDIDYKNVSLLKKFMGPRKKILPQSVTKLAAKHQRKLKIEIRKARVMGLLPFTDRHALS